MNIEIKLPVTTFSVNDMFYGNRYVTKTSYREWMSDVFEYLAQESYQTVLSKIRDFFDAKKHAMEVCYTAYYPESEFFTKKGTLSARIHDITNWEKPLQDLLFNEKHGARAYPYGVENLKIDDKVIMKMTSQKKPTKEDKRYIMISIKCVDYNDLI